MALRRGGVDPPLSVNWKTFGCDIDFIGTHSPARRELMTEMITNTPDEVHCGSCGAIIKRAAEICVKCGVRNLSANDPNVSQKSRLVAFLLAWFVGIFGVHRFYVGKTTSGILQILFGWATFFIWNLVDMIMILAGVFKDSEGKVIKRWNTD
jgi:TM2 domain-containing membrane protein YozV